VVLPRIDSEAALDAAFDAPAFLLLKHSHRCGVSSKAFREFEAFFAEGSTVPGGFVNVVEDRPLSLRIAERSGVPHASPQAILLRDGRAVWDASHFGITRKALAEALR